MVLKRKEISLPVTLFYDGECPLCMREVDHLARKNRKGLLKLVDIRQDGFQEKYPEFDLAELDRVIHAKLADGRVVKGVDATLAAWEAVGMGCLVAPLRWPGVACIADFGYELFARNRHGLSRRLGPILGKNECNKP
ncbi:thiol-disulfide oxidoreductase DCC family protein [Endozoicomonas acroporae]|uniref:thiol-disulfide oxidoreductase DCC family protein n=1 Tax=Endozoicomonas acroporae TaxID=1701104 RepID=UPI003D7AAEC8